LLRELSIFKRRELVLPETPREAWAVAACDNSYTLYVNGTRAGAGKDFGEPNLVDLRSYLKKGTNWIAVAAVNHTPDNKAPEAGQVPKAADANPAGFIFFTRIRLAKETLEVATDRSWRASKTRTSGWEKAARLMSDAVPAAEIGEPSMAPWNAGRTLAATLGMARAHTDVRASLVAADPLMVALGRPNREQVITTRASAATTLQSLEMTNGETLSKVLRQGADKVLAERPASNRELVTGLYRKALGREPSKAEFGLANELLGKSAGREQVEDLLWAMAMHPEFQLIY
jgi:hypothetical protein